MPTYRIGRRRLYVATWQHGISLYGWGHDRDGGFTSSHPDLVTSKGTIRLRPEQADSIPDQEFLGLARAALAP
jgi:hypothetical protein